MSESDKKLLFLALIAIGAYLLWTKFKSVTQTITAPLTTGIADLYTYVASAWGNMTLFPTMQVLGDVQLPDGSTVATSQLTLKGDPQGRVFTQVGGHYYQLSPWVQNPDGSVVYPATLVG